MCSIPNEADWLVWASLVYLLFWTGILQQIPSQLSSAMLEPVAGFAGLLGQTLIEVLIENIRTISSSCRAVNILIDS